MTTINYFTQETTAGFSDAELAMLNAELARRIAALEPADELVAEDNILNLGDAVLDEAETIFCARPKYLLVLAAEARDYTIIDDVYSAHDTLDEARGAFLRLPDSALRCAYITQMDDDGRIPGRADATWERDLARDFFPK